MQTRLEIFLEDYETLLINEGLYTEETMNQISEFISSFHEALAEDSSNETSLVEKLNFFSSTIHNMQELGLFSNAQKQSNLDRIFDTEASDELSIATSMLILLRVKALINEQEKFNFLLQNIESLKALIHLQKAGLLTGEKGLENFETFLALVSMDAFPLEQVYEYLNKFEEQLNSKMSSTAKQYFFDSLANNPKIMNEIANLYFRLHKHGLINKIFTDDEKGNEYHQKLMEILKNNPKLFLMFNSNLAAELDRGKLTKTQALMMITTLLSNAKDVDLIIHYTLKQLNSSGSADINNAFFIEMAKLENARLKAEISEARLIPTSPDLQLGSLPTIKQKHSHGFFTSPLPVLTTEPNRITKAFKILKHAGVSDDVKEAYSAALTTANVTHAEELAEGIKLLSNKELITNADNTKYFINILADKNNAKDASKIADKLIKLQERIQFMHNDQPGIIIQAGLKGKDYSKISTICDALIDLDNKNKLRGNANWEEEVDKIINPLQIKPKSSAAKALAAFKGEKILGSDDAQVASFSHNTFIASKEKNPEKMVFLKAVPPGDKEVAYIEVAGQEKLRLLMPWQPKTRITQPKPNDRIEFPDGRSMSFNGDALLLTSYGIKGSIQFQEGDIERLAQSYGSTKFTYTDRNGDPQEVDLKGFAEVADAAKLVGEVDFKTGNIFFDPEGRVFKIDGDWLGLRAANEGCALILKSLPLSISDVDMAAHLQRWLHQLEVNNMTALVQHGEQFYFLGKKVAGSWNITKLENLTQAVVNDIKKLPFESERVARNDELFTPLLVDTFKDLHYGIVRWNTAIHADDLKALPVPLHYTAHNFAGVFSSGVRIEPTAAFTQLATNPQFLKEKYQLWLKILLLPESAMKRLVDIHVPDEKLAKKIYNFDKERHEAYCKEIMKIAVECKEKIRLPGDRSPLNFLEYLQSDEAKRYKDEYKNYLLDFKIVEKIHLYIDRPGKIALGTDIDARMEKALAAIKPAHEESVVPQAPGRSL